MSDANKPLPSLVPALGLAILNGMFSPFLIIIFALNGLWYPFFLPASQGAVFLVSSLILSTLTLMLAGVPAAIYERVSGGGSSFTSRMIWLVAVALLTLPAIPNIMAALGLAGN